MSGNVRSAIDVRDESLAKQVAQQLEVAARDAVSSLRIAINNLRRSAVDEAGIVATLARYARTFSTQSGISVDFTTERVTTLPSSVGLLVYESCQEALRNVSRHADAKSVHVTLRRAGAHVELVVRDDGVGMERSRRSRASSDEGSGVGLRLLHDKIELAGGTLMINAPKGGGTEIVISIPLDDGAEMGVEEP
jgi:signal transduction histidine kinase